MIEGAVKSILTSNAAVSAAVGTRVRPLSAAQHDVRPFLVYEVTGAEPTRAKGFTRYTVEIGIYADTMKECADLSWKVREALDRYSGTVAEVHVCPCLFDEQTEIQQTPAGTETPACYVRVQTYRLLVKQTN